MKNDVLSMEEEKQKLEKEKQEMIKEHKRCLNETFSSKEGQYTLKQIGINSGFFNPSATTDPMFAGKRKMFLDIFSFLDNDIKKKVIDDIYNA